MISTLYNSFPACSVFSSSCLVTISNNGYSCASGLNGSFLPTELFLLSYITTDGQSASLSCYQAPIWGLWPDFYYCQTIAGFFIWGALSEERTGLSFTMYSVQYTVYFTVSDLRLPQPGGLGPCIYISQEQGGPVIPPGTQLVWSPVI
jgi:hypothetical protein